MINGRVTHPGRQAGRCRFCIRQQAGRGTGAWHLRGRQA